MNRIFAIAASLAFFGVAILGSENALAQQSITVLVDGSSMTLGDQPAVDQGGRIFVPMRAIFERLGAMVVYDNGTINATRGRRTISLQIGSVTATVDGQPVQLDAPPFEIGARTLVPLRFVAQALGANVSWSEANMTVYIHTAGMSGDVPPGGPAPPYHPGSSVQQPGPSWADAGHPLLHRPFPWGSISRPYPLISASFRRPMRPDSIRVTLDGRNETGIAKITAMGFELTPAFRLHVGTHNVRISGVAQDGAPVTDGWSFTVTE